MSAPQRQLVLDLPHRAALGAEDFIVSPSNEAAVAMIDRWPDWPSHVLVLTGPAGCGKTHLANVWRLRSGAPMLPAADAGEAAVLAMAAAHAGVIEDIDGERGSDQALFHLLNLAREQDFRVLVTARTAPGDWSIGLPDLRSRLRAAPVVAIGEPDSTLLRAVLVKLLADRQLPATPHAINHLVLHMERSMRFALEVVETIDRLLWAKPGQVTRALAGRALAELGAGSGDDHGAAEDDPGESEPSP